MMKKILKSIIFISLVGCYSTSIIASQQKNHNNEEDKEKISTAKKAIVFLFVNILAHRATDIVTLYGVPPSISPLSSGMYSGMLGYIVSKLFDKKDCNGQTYSDVVKEIAVPAGVGITSRLLYAGLYQAYKFTHDFIRFHNTSWYATPNVKDVIQNIVSGTASLEVISGIVIGVLLARFVYNKLVPKTQDKENLRTTAVQVTPLEHVQL